MSKRLFFSMCPLIHENNGSIKLVQFVIQIIPMQSNAGRNQTNIVDYLVKQNKKLREQNEDYREMIKMNKIEIDVLSKNNSKNKYIEIIGNYRVANENNQKKIELLQARIEEMISEKLMNEQLYNSATSELKAEEELHKDRILQLQQVIKELQKKVTTYEKGQRTYDTITGFVERNRDIFNPTEQAIEFKNKETEMNEEIHLLKTEIKKEKQNQDSLLKINGILRHKVVTLQAKLAMPSKNFGDILDKSLKRLMMYFIETQRRLLTGDESDSQGQQDLQLIAPELSTYFGEQNLRKQKEYTVPHLDLLKIRGSVVNGNEKIKAQLIKRNHLTKQQKIERLEIQLEYTRRQLTKIMIDFREEKDRRKLLQRFCEEMESRNECLIESNNKLSEKLNKLTKKIKESKEKQMKFIEIDETINDMSTTIIKMDNNYVQNKHKEPAQPLKAVNQNFDIYQSPQEYKIHLELLARDLAKNKKIQNLEHLTKKKENININEQEWKPRLKKSTSNPFLYFNERREEILGVNENMNAHNEQNMRLQQTQIFPNIRMDHGQNLDDIYI